MSPNLEAIAIEFINAIPRRSSSRDLLKFYHPDFEQTEFPNLVTKNKTVRTLQDIKTASEKGKKILQKEEYEIIHSYSFSNIVVIECIWTGTLAITLGSIPAGGEMKAYFAQFFEFKDNKIFRLRNYDCFEPF